MADARAPRRRRPGERDAGTRIWPSGSGHYESEHRMLHRNGTFRWVLCRGAAVRNADGTRDAAGRLAHRRHRRQGVRCVDRAAEPADVRRPARARDQAVHRRPGLRVRAARPRPRPVQGRQQQPRTADGGSPARRGRAPAAVEPARHRRRHARRHRAARSRGSAGDEFTVLLDDITDASDAVRVAERLRSALEKPFEVDGQQVFTSATVGIAVSTTGIRPAGRDPARCRDRAPPREGRPDDAAASCSIRRCATARSRGCRSRPTCGRRSRTAGSSSSTSRSWRSRPAASSPSRRSCAGAIPTRGIVAPDHFIGVAEETGMIVPIGQLALAESCRQMARWQQTFGADAPTRDLREHVEPAVRRCRSRERDRSGPAGDGAEGVEPDARDHRERVHRRRRGRAARR